MPALKALLASCLLLLTAAAAASAAKPPELVSRSKVDPRLVQLDFSTPALANGAAAARVLLPPGYKGSHRRYPVLLLLHGASYDETGWSTEGRIEAIVGDRKLIVVMPNGGGNGYYTNWFNEGRFGQPAYETFHIRQLLPWIDDHFRTRATRRGRLVAGFSMGGFGAMSYAARHPDTFSGAFSFSGAIDTNYPLFQPIGELSSQADGGAYGAIWGRRQAEEVRWRAKNPWDLAPNLRGMTLQIRTGNGQGGGDFGGPAFDPIEFGVHEMAISMHDRLSGLGIPHGYEDYGPGAHEFPYYRRDLTKSLPAMMASFRNPPPVPRRFEFRSAQPRYSAHGYGVRIERPALEFSSLRARRSGRAFSLSGSGDAVVTTPKLRPGTRYLVRIDGPAGNAGRLVIRAGRSGRLRVPVSLGPGNPEQQYTAAAAAAGGTTVRTAKVSIQRARPSRPERLAAGGAAPAWVPDPRDRWQYQLEGGKRALAASGGIDVDICSVPFTGGACVRPDVFDIDLYEDANVAGKEGVPNSAAVDAIHSRGAHAVCYVSAGTAEKFRPDYQRYVRFDRSHGGRLIGKPFSDRFSNENWLDIGPRVNRRFVLRQVQRRTGKCARAGFDGIEYDVVDAFAQGRKVTGFRITAAEQLRFNRSLAAIAHSRDLAVGLKNDLPQIEELEPRFDFAINEQCLQYRECTNNPPPGYRAFLAAGKAVAQVEYRLRPKAFCPEANRLGLSSIKKAGNFSLNAEPWIPCR